MADEVNGRPVALERAVEDDPASPVVVVRPDGGGRPIDLYRILSIIDDHQHLAASMFRANYDAGGRLVADVRAPAEQPEMSDAAAEAFSAHVEIMRKLGPIVGMAIERVVLHDEPITNVRNPNRLAVFERGLSVLIRYYGEDGR